MNRKWEQKDLVYCEALQQVLHKMVLKEVGAKEVVESYFGFKWLDELHTEIKSYLDNPPKAPETLEEAMKTATIEPTKDGESTSPIKKTSRKKKTSTRKKKVTKKSE